MSDFVVCSFYTNDDYYRTCAESLGRDLEQLGADHIIEEVQVGQSEDWADTCRKKIPFLAKVCADHPSQYVYWVDVDCRLLALPSFVTGTSADLIGFSRGFGSSLGIGYQGRTRFWEPSFLGIAPSRQARKFVHDAAAAEAASTAKATDDYFLEEAWRANADSLSFQIIPSTCVIGRGNVSGGRDAFLVFGSSGNVEKFKGRVAQHAGSRRQRLNRQVVKLGKATVRRLPPAVGRHVVNTADRLGLTSALAGHGPSIANRDRRALSNKALRAGLDGNLDRMGEAITVLHSRGVPSATERGVIQAARSFGAYAGRRPHPRGPLSLAWWARPFPGNFGDWLSPLIIGAFTDQPILFKSPQLESCDPHMVSTGSIGRFVEDTSVVVGTGVSTPETVLAPKAHYVSVRGPLTAKALIDSGGPQVDTFGDPAVLLSRIVSIERGTTNGRVAFVRHFAHAKAPVLLPEHFDELSVLVSHPDDLRGLLRKLVSYDVVVTSAMHVFIACQSYGVPSALVTFEGLEPAVHGSGMKYEDYAAGAEVEAVRPVSVPLDLRKYSLDSLVRTDRISEAKKDEVQSALTAAINRMNEMKFERAVHR